MTEGGAGSGHDAVAREREVEAAAGARSSNRGHCGRWVVTDTGKNATTRSGVCCAAARVEVGDLAEVGAGEEDARVVGCDDEGRVTSMPGEGVERS